MASHRTWLAYALYALSLGVGAVPALWLTTPPALAQMPPPAPPPPPDGQARPVAGGVSASSVKAGVDAWSRKDYTLAVQIWQAPADAGDPDAEFDLGQAYKLGRGVPQDLAKAETLFGQAAAKGHIAAANNYGLLLFQRGAHTQAMPYIQAAADHGEPRAQYLLGIAYFNADTVAKDWVRAYAYETLAQKSGLTQAKAALAQMDSYIPMAQRQQGAAMAGEMASQTESSRMRALAVNGMGNNSPVNTLPASDSPPPQPASPLSQSPLPPGWSIRAQPAPPQSPPPQPVDASPPPPVQRPARVVMNRPPPAQPDDTPPADQSTPSDSDTGGAWMIQLGAFSVPANIEAQWNRVKTMAGVAGHSRRLAPTGRVQRLLALGYSAASAKSTCARLASSGITCLPVKN